MFKVNNCRSTDIVLYKNKRNKYILIYIGLIIINISIIILLFHNACLNLILPIIIFLLSNCFFIFIMLKRLKNTINTLEATKLNNKTLNDINDSLQIFKHDFSNILQCIDGYIINNDMNGLKNYFNSLKLEFNYTNSLTNLNSNVSDSAIYNLIVSKYYKAEELNINFHINFSVNFNDLPVSPYIITRILGILLDNAIEATKNCKEKEIYFNLETEYYINKKYILTIKNTYSDKNLNLNNLYKKGYTSKKFDKSSHGLGLWEINKIVKRNKNLNLYTDKNNTYFIQRLEIL